MEDKKKSLRMVYLSTDAAGRNKRLSRTYSDMLPDADNTSAKKAADAINTLTAKPCDAVEIVTVEALV